MAHVLSEFVKDLLANTIFVYYLALECLYSHAVSSYIEELVSCLGENRIKLVLDTRSVYL